MRLLCCCLLSGCLLTTSKLRCWLAGQTVASQPRRPPRGLQFKKLIEKCCSAPLPRLDCRSEDRRRGNNNRKTKGTMKKSLLLRAEDCGSSPMIKRPCFGLVAEPPSPLSPIQANAISVPTPSGQCPSANALRYALSPSPTTATGTNTNNDKSASARSFPGALLFASSPTAHSPSAAAAATTGATKSDEEQSCADALIAAANGMSTCRSMSVTVPTKAATKEKNNGPAKATASLPLNIDTNDDRTCKCTKSKCLKLYCECFSGGVACGANCGCKNCENIEGTFERNEAIEAAIKKNSDCFATKRQTRAEKKAVLKSYSASNGQALTTQCRCKRSKCIKLYCECFSAGNHLVLVVVAVNA